MGFSDALDGFIARQFKCESILGSYLDAIADKAMVNISFCCLCFIHILPYYLFFIGFAERHLHIFRNIET